MRRNIIGITLMLLVGAFILGCSGLSRQYRASTEGMSLNYVIQKEQLFDPKEPITILLRDERIDKDFIGEGAKPNVGNKFLGYLAFGVFYAIAPDQPTFQEKEDPVNVFKIAMSQRLKNNGILISNDNNSTVVLEILLRRFKLDFTFGRWIAEVGYVAKINKCINVVCEDDIFEKISKFNTYGYGSGEEAINQVFNKSINSFDFNSCFSGNK